MVGTGNSAGHYTESSKGVGSNGCRGGKEVVGQDGGHACILHPDLNAAGATFGCGEMAEGTDSVAKQIAEGVVTENNGHREKEELQTIFNELWVNLIDDSADNAAEAEHTQGRCDGFNVFIDGPASEKDIE